MDTKNAFGPRPTTLRAPEPFAGPLRERPSERTTLGYGHGWSLAEEQVLRGRSPRPEQGSHAGSRSIG